MADVLDQRQIHAALADHPHWEFRDEALVRLIDAPSFMAGIRLVDEVAVVADGLNHHPDIDIRWTTITFRLSTHAVGGVTEYDVELAGRIDGIVERLND